MGNCGSTPAGDPAERQASKKIDSALNKDKKVLNSEIRILLLGTGESGKSTVAKQMKIIHLTGFNDEEKRAYKPIVFHNVCRAAQILISQARKRDIELQVENEGNASMVMEVTLSEAIDYTSELAHAIDALWKDPGIQAVFALSSQYQLSDSVEYFLGDCTRFCQPSYVPNELDILRVRAKTTGIAETIFTIGKSKFRMIDVGGQRSERKKWIHCFQDVTVIIFCVSLNEYDLMLEEDCSVNRMHESIKLFGDIINNQWFQSTSIILFLNKKDLFEQKIKKVDLKVCFPSYSGGLNYDKALSFITDQFHDQNKNSNRELFTHATIATDTANIRVVFSAIENIWLNEDLNQLGLGV